MVVKTGMATKMGEISHLLAEADSGDSPLEIKLEALVHRARAVADALCRSQLTTMSAQGVRLGIASLTCSVIVFIIGVSTSECRPRIALALARDRPAHEALPQSAASTPTTTTPRGCSTSSSPSRSPSPPFRCGSAVSARPECVNV